MAAMLCVNLERLTKFGIDKGEMRSSTFGIWPKKKAVERRGHTVSESEKRNLAASSMGA